MQYKLSKYVHVNKTVEYTALYNYLNSKLIIVSLPKDKVLIDNFLETGCFFESSIFDVMKSYDMIIDNEYDEDLLLDYLMKRAYYSNKRLEITIIPGQACNFRCLYCYEAKNTPVILPEILNGITYFIKEMIDEYRYQELRVFWFGGEPTLYSKIVNEYMNELKRELPDIKITGCMTTNGYLLSESEFIKYYSLGIDTYQITVDGFSSTHDILRPLKDGQGTWERVIGNLLNIKRLDGDFTILFRINFNEDMLGQVFDFLDYIKKNFDKRFIVHLHPIFKTSDDLLYSNEMCDPNIEHYAKMAIYDYLIDEEIVSDVPIMLTSFASQICYAAKPNSYVIDENGAIKKCTVALDKDINNVGQIINSQKYTINLYKLAKWTESRLHDEKCYHCVCRPACNSTTGCPLSLLGKNPSCGSNLFYANYYIDRLIEHLYRKSKKVD